jgi:thioredoxin-related protein
MKVLLRISFLTILFISCNTKQKTTVVKGIQWLSLSEVENKMKKNPKKILIDIYTDWCGPCKRMSKYTFTDPSVVKVVNKHFYAVKFNAESRQEITFLQNKFVNNGRTHDLAIQLGSTTSGLSYPTIVYFDEFFKKLQAVPGYYQAQEYVPVLKYFGEDHYRKMNFDSYSKSLN